MAEPDPNSHDNYPTYQSVADLRVLVRPSLAAAAFRDPAGLVRVASATTGLYPCGCRSAPVVSRIARDACLLRNPAFERRTGSGYPKSRAGPGLSEMHDTVKQSIHGIALSADAALEADRRGERDRVREMLGRTLAASREAEYKVSQPYDELRAFQGEGSPSITEHLSNRLDKFEQYFGVTTHEDFQAPLDSLNAAEIAVVYRVVVEAFWNVAKHAQARNMRLESRRVGRTLILRVRDDGRGFDAASPPPGMGLAYMRQRAGEVGAKLDVISTPGRGACIQLRFDKG